MPVEFLDTAGTNDDSETHARFTGRFDRQGTRRSPGAGHVMPIVRAEVARRDRERARLADAS
jgi:hypothetical protein